MGEQRPKLTQRQRQVCERLLGKTDSDIASELGISEETVAHHLRKVYEKLGVSSRIEAAVKFSKLAKQGELIAA